MSKMNGDRVYKNIPFEGETKQELVDLIYHINDWLNNLELAGENPDVVNKLLLSIAAQNITKKEGMPEIKRLISILIETLEDYI